MSNNRNNATERVPCCKGGDLANPSITFVIDQDKMKFRTHMDKIRKGGQGFGVSRENVAYTLNTRDESWVAFVVL